MYFANVKKDVNGRSAGWFEFADDVIGVDNFGMSGVGDMVYREYGFDVDERTINYYELYHKLSAARFLNYDYFRTTIFDCMSLLSQKREDKSDGIL